jgi:hypothetical protein
VAGPTGNPVAALPPNAQPITSQPPTVQWYQWFKSVKRVLAPGISTTVALAKLTTGGTAGSLTVVNGVITAYTAPT